MTRASGTNWKVTRRALLQGSAATLLTPWLLPERSHASSAKRPRFILIRDTLGFGHKGRRQGPPAPHRLIPPGARDADGMPLPRESLPTSRDGSFREVVFAGAADLPASLHPLRDYWANTVVLDRFFNPHDASLHGNGHSTFTVMPPGELVDGRPAPSLQEMLGLHLGADSPFSVVSMSQKDDAPVRYHQRLFGAIGPSAQGRLTQRKQAMEVARAQAARVRARLGPSEDDWLASYLDSLNSAEQTLERLANWECAVPPLPSEGSNLGQYDPVLPLMSEANTDLAAAALICGLTQTVSLAFVPGRGPFHFMSPHPNEFNLDGALAEQAISSRTTYGQLASGLVLESTASGAPKDSWGEDRHNGHHNGFEIMQTAIDRWEAALVARLIERLADTPEGDGSMWDNTVILWVNTAGGIHHHGVDDHPAVLLAGPNLVGPKAGQLRGGRYLSYDKNAHCLSDLYVSVANLLGSPISSFGDPELCQGPLPGVAVGS